MRNRIEFICSLTRSCDAKAGRKLEMNSAANSPIKAPDAPTEIKEGGTTASETSAPPSAPTTKKAKNHRRPTRRSRNQPPNSNATPLPRIWSKFACRSGAVNSRYHSPSDRMAIRLMPPIANSVPTLGCIGALGGMANTFSNAKIATRTASSASVSHGTVNSARPTSACIGTVSEAAANSEPPAA